MLRAQGDGVTPHAVQIAGCEPKAMAEAARLAEDVGADLIDINMGCPAQTRGRRRRRFGADARSRSWPRG